MLFVTLKSGLPFKKAPQKYGFAWTFLAFFLKTIRTIEELDVVQLIDCKLSIIFYSSKAWTKKLRPHKQA